MLRSPPPLSRPCRRRSHPPPGKQARSRLEPSDGRRPRPLARCRPWEQASSQAERASSTRPPRHATPTASTFECTPSLRRMFLTWVFTVAGLIPSSRAIPVVVAPLGHRRDDLAFPLRQRRQESLAGTPRCVLPGAGQRASGRSSPEGRARLRPPVGTRSPGSTAPDRQAGRRRLRAERELDLRRARDPGSPPSREPASSPDLRDDRHASSVEPVELDDHDVRLCFSEQLRALPSRRRPDRGLRTRSVDGTRAAAPVRERRLSATTRIGSCPYLPGTSASAGPRDEPFREECGTLASMNRLARETSPYLLQHAENPVDWFPWGEEALARRGRRSGRSSSRSATPRATGATSWSASRSRMRRPPPS